jgi:hypothetical protein
MISLPFSLLLLLLPRFYDAQGYICIGAQSHIIQINAQQYIMHTSVHSYNTTMAHSYNTHWCSIIYNIDHCFQNILYELVISKYTICTNGY